RHDSLASALPEPPLVLVNVAWLSYTPQFANEVVATTCTVIDAPGPSDFGPHDSTCEPSAPLIEQSALSGLSVQCTVPDVPPGRLAEIEAPLAVPVPLFVNVTVKPTWPPASTGAL